MDEILKLQRKLAELAGQNRARLDKAQAEDRALTDEERTASEAVKVEIETVKRRIDDLSEQESLEAALAKSSRQTAPEASGIETRSAAKPPAVEVRNHEDTNLAMRFGLWLQEVRAASQGAGIGPRLEASLREARALGANVSDPASGGFLVTKDVSQSIFQRMYQQGQILSRCNKLPALSASADKVSIPAIDESSRATGSRAGGVTGYWVAEGVAPTASRPKLREVELELHGVAALGYATDKLLRHAAILGTIMQQAFADELMFLAENAVFRGTGAGQPQGVLSSGALVSVAKEAGQGAATILFENIVKMHARMWSRSRMNAAWFINQDIEPQLYTMSLAVGTGGVPVYLPAGGLSDSPFASLMGKPVIPCEYSSSLGTIGDITLLDLSQYFLIDGGSPESAQSMHVAFSTFEQAFRAKYEVDGQSAWRTTLTPFQGSNTLSPFVALATRS